MQTLRQPSLVVLAGAPRGNEIVHASLDEHLLRPYQADLALLFGSSMPIPSSLRRRAKYVWSIDEPKDWGVVWDEACTELGLPRDAWRAVLDRAASIEHGEVKSASIFGPVIHRNRTVLGSSTISGAFSYWLWKRHAQTLMQYATVVYSRADHAYLCKHPLLDVTLGATHAVFVPTGEDYVGVCDRHRVFHPQDAEAALAWVLWVARNLPSIHSTLTSEEALLRSLHSHGITQEAGRLQRFSRPMFLAAAPGDSTRWSLARTPVPSLPGLKLKYPSEYRLAAATCNAADIPKRTRAYFVPPAMGSSGLVSHEADVAARGDAPPPLSEKKLRLQRSAAQVRPRSPLQQSAAPTEIHS